MITRTENRRLAEAAYDRGDAVVRNAPEISGIEGTNHCNIKCIMCPRGEPDIMRREIGHMERKTFENLLKGARYFSDVCWLHWFGEPLMNPAIFDLIKCAKTKIPNVGISTNATLLTSKASERLLDSGLDTIVIAIDGDTKDIYESVRKSTHFTFEQVTANAERFLALKAKRRSSKPHVIMSIIVMDVTAPDLERYRQRWKAAGANEILFKAYADWGAQRPDIFDGLRVGRKHEARKSPRRHPCKFLWSSMVVSWNGDVVPCCFDYDAKMVMGNVNEQSIDEIWNGPAYVELRRAEIEGCNHSSLCASCTQAPGRRRKRVW
jgi:radical SAM protein with 4Fe4S-binding SPASM domain